MAQEWGRERWQALGLGSAYVTMGDAAPCCTVGCILRERERLARIVEGMGQPDIATALRDSRRDGLVFKYQGPETGLDVPPELK